MDEELKCPVCRKPISDPVVLPCNHRICCRCLENLSSQGKQPDRRYTEFVISKDAECDGTNNPKDAKASDADSGYSTISSTSEQQRPQFYDDINHVATDDQQRERATPPLNSEGISSCPVCNRKFFVNGWRAGGIRRSQSMVSTATNHRQIEPVTRMDSVPAPQYLQLQGLPQCEMCDVSAAVPAAIKCEQCQVRYCENCLQRFHPPRGPLASHVLVAYRQGYECGKNRGRRKSGVYVTTPTGYKPPPGMPATDTTANTDDQDGIKLSKCSFHVVEDMSMYCDECHVALCYRCQEDGRHRGHSVQSIASVCKKYKADLSQVMSALSGKARRVTDLIVQLRRTPEEIQKNGGELEAQTLSQCDALVEAIERKKRDILQLLNSEKERKCKVVRDQLQHCTMKLKRTTGLLEYCIEVMKDNDPALFLQVSPGLIQRVSATEQQWSEDQLTPKTGSGMDIDLDSSALMKAIEGFNITHRGVPEKPFIKISECAAVNNTVTLSWRIPPLSRIDAFILELDDGAKGPFRDVYHGKQTACTIDGLHFDSVYRARVSAYNKTGRSPCSDVVQLQTSEVAIFRMDPNQSHRDVRFSHDHCTINCVGADQRVALSNTGFSRGIHYWEYSVDRYESSNTDIVVGVAVSKVNTDHILGKDVNGWSMYVDSSRTWFLHNNQHTNRVDAGVQVGSRLGVLLNFDNQSITYFVNQKQRGDPVFIANAESLSKTSKTKLLYPAVSLNKDIQLTLWSGLRPAFNSKNSAFNYSGTRTPTCQPLTPNGEKVLTHSVSSLEPNSANIVVNKRSQSSFDLKASQQSSERLYHSLPPKLPVKKNPVPVRPHTMSKRLSVTGDPSVTFSSNILHHIKPAVKRKPLPPAPPSRDSSFRREAKPEFIPSDPPRKPQENIPTIQVWEENDL